MTNEKGSEAENTFLHNLKCCKYKQALFPLEERVVSMTTVGDHVIVGTVKYGCQVFRIAGDAFERICALGEQPRSEGKPGNQRIVGGSTCTEVSASKEDIVYIKEVEGESRICVHKLQEVLKGATEPCRTHALKRRAPMVVEHTLGILAISAIAWKASWTTGEEKDEVIKQGKEECKIRVLDLKNFTTHKEMCVVDNSISILRLQILPEHSMLGVADSLAGLRVYDLQQATTDGYTLLYQVPVGEVRNFQLVGNFVGVFHKFEPNVTFWNMREQKTILCINIQDQMRELVEQQCDVEEDDEGGVYDDDDNDHVTAVTCVKLREDYLLIYGTRSGCLFGMSVDSRTKLFSIPCPHGSTQDENCGKKHVQALCYVANGRVVSAYEGHGITLLDFNDEPKTAEKPK